MPDFAVATHFTVQEQLTQFFARGETNARRFSDSVNQAFDRSGRSADLFKQILGGVTVGNLISSGISKIGEAVKSTVKQLPEFAEKMDAVSKTSRTIGVSVENLQRLQYAAGLSNVSTDQLSISFKKLNNELALQHSRQGTLYTTMAKLNPQLSRQLYTTKTSEQAFLVVADAVQKAGSAQQRAAIATATFGKSGQEMLPMLMEGKKGISEMMAEASKYGTVVDTKTAVAAEHFNDTLMRFNTGVTAVKYSVLSSLMTAVIPYMEKGAEWIAQNKELIATKINTFVKDTTTFIKNAIPYVKTTISLIREFAPPILSAVAAYTAMKYAMIAAAAAGNLFAVLNTVMFAYQAYAGGAATAQEALNMVMSANPIGLVVAALAVLVGVTVLVVRHWSQITSAVGKAWNTFTGFSTWIGGKFVSAIMVAGQTVLKFLLAPINYVTEGIVKLLSVMSKIPGMSGLKGIADSISSVQARANTMLTGSASYGYRSVTEPVRTAFSAGVSERISPVNTRTAPNEAAVQRSEFNFTGRLEIAGAPAGSKFTQKSTGPSKLRTEMMGVN
jgi:hypothetical protein